MPRGMKRRIPIPITPRFREKMPTRMTAKAASNGEAAMRPYRNDPAITDPSRRIPAEIDGETCAG